MSADAKIRQSSEAGHRGPVDGTKSFIKYLFISFLKHLVYFTNMTIQIRLHIQGGNFSIENTIGYRK